MKNQVFLTIALLTVAGTMGAMQKGIVFHYNGGTKPVSMVQNGIVTPIVNGVPVSKAPVAPKAPAVPAPKAPAMKAAPKAPAVPAPKAPAMKAAPKAAAAASVAQRRACPKKACGAPNAQRTFRCHGANCSKK